MVTRMIMSMNMSMNRSAVGSQDVLAVPLGTGIEPSRFATPVKPLSAHDAPASNAYAERG
jgi:hypothetical protein